MRILNKKPSLIHALLIITTCFQFSTVEALHQQTSKEEYNVEEPNFLARYAAIGAIVIATGGLVAAAVSLSSKKEKKGGTGPQGSAGIEGNTGIKGTPGDKGPKGPRGFRGKAGPEGPIGPRGPQGDSIGGGPTGPTGAKGPNLTGPVGPSQIGTQGPTGDTGLAGSSIRGPTGPKGPSGLGRTGPQGIQGVQGPTGSLSGPTQTGPTGPTGPTGARGLTGNQGTAGAMGSNGAMGAQGPQGPPASVANLRGLIAVPTNAAFKSMATTISIDANSNTHFDSFGTFYIYDPAMNILFQTPLTIQSPTIYHPTITFTYYGTYSIVAVVTNFQDVNDQVTILFQTSTFLPYEDIGNKSPLYRTSLSTEATISLDPGNPVVTFAVGVSEFILNMP